MSKKSNIQDNEKYLPKGLSKNTLRNYNAIVSNYESFHNMTLGELIQEAIQEQTDRVPEHELKIYDRLLDYRNYVDETKLASTATQYVTIIKLIYKNNRIRLPSLPHRNTIHLNKNPEIEYKDILTPDEIRFAMKMLSLTMKARTEAIISGGLSNAEADILTSRQYIDDLYPYHQCDDDREALEYLANKNHNHIWVTLLKRVKTGKPFYAVFHPEAVQMIALAKLEEKELNPKLLTNNAGSYYNKLLELSHRYDFGKAGGHHRLRPHMLRKFHATRISTSVLDYAEESSLRNFEIDELQGRGKTGVQDRYIKTNPIRQKFLYAKVMNRVALYNEYEYEFVDGDVKVWRKNYKDNNKILREENEHMKKELDKGNKMNKFIENYIEEYGYDSFREDLTNLINQL